MPRARRDQWRVACLACVTGRVTRRVTGRVTGLARDACAHRHPRGCEGGERACGNEYDRHDRARERKCVCVCVFVFVCVCV